MFARVSAARQAELKEIAADLEPGTKRDAILYACGSNKHGKVRTPDDKRRAVTRMLSDDVWGGWSNYQIAKHCGVGEKLVRTVRRAIYGSAVDSEPLSRCRAAMLPLSGVRGGCGHGVAGAASRGRCG